MVERSFTRSLSSLEHIFAYVREVLGGEAAAADRARDVDLILEELFTNMVKYSAGGANISIDIDWTPPTLTLRLRDYGVEPFDVTRVPPVDTDATLASGRVGGLGLHLVRSLADRLEYAHENGTSTITVTMRLA